MLSLVACGLISGAESEQAGSNSEMAQSGLTGGSATPRAPVPFERRGPVSVPTTARDTVPAPRRTASGQPEREEPTDVTSRGDVDRAAAKAAVEADGYKRVTILGAGPNGTWRAKAYRGDTEVALTIDFAGA